MKENRTYTLTIVSLILSGIALISLVFLGYHSMSGNEPGRKKPKTAKRSPEKKSAGKPASDSGIAPGNVAGDTSQREDPDAEAPATALYDPQNIQYAKLRDEIAEMIRNSESQADLDKAREKIRELNSKIDELNRNNLKMQYENKRLSIALSRLEKMRNRRSVVPVEAPAEETEEKPAAPEPVKNNCKLQNLVLNAMYTDGIQETETKESAKAEKFAGFFTCRNLTDKATETEVVLVITGPDGKVVSNDWESGLFETTKGQMPYSFKIRFDFPAGASKKMPFTVDNQRFLKGNYSIEAFQEGKSLGKTNRYLF